MTATLDCPAPLVDDATRRKFLIGGASLAALLAGCATSDPPAAAPAPEPRTITHAFGATEVPTTPQRIVTLGFVDQDAVLALGFTPIAVREWVGERPPTEWPWQETLVGDVKPESLPFELDLEQLAALQPDLILAIWAGITEAEYADLSRIAPTVAHETAYAEDAFLAPWETRTRFTGRILGRADRADQLVAEVETRFAQARGRHPEFESATFALVDGPVEGNVFVFTPVNPRGFVIDALGFTVPDEIAAISPETGVAEISQEQLELVDQDVVLWISEEGSNVRAMPLYGQLDAVSEGRDAFADLPLVTALTFGTVLSLSYALDRLEPMLAAALDGDPATG